MAIKVYGDYKDESWINVYFYKELSKLMSDRIVYSDSKIPDYGIHHVIAVDKYGEEHEALVFIWCYPYFKKDIKYGVIVKLDSWDIEDALYNYHSQNRLY